MAGDAAARAAPLVVSIVGTRPEAIKMAPVIRSLATRERLRQQVILTGQHPALKMSLGSATPPVIDLQVDLREQTAGEICETLRHEISMQLLRLRPDLVLVQGDTTSAVAGALAAQDCNVAVGHVEAGLRSGDLQQPWPEEGNRIRIDRTARLLFAPSEFAASHLREERVVGEVHVTGNSGIDALLDARGGLAEPATDEPRKLVLVTCHRRENWGALPRLAAALKQIAEELPLEIGFLLHTNPQLRRAACDLLGGNRRIQLLEPVEHDEMVALMDRSWLVLTDSGGLQEEAPALGKPVLVLRDVTERGEALRTENIELVGTDPERIIQSIRRLLDEPDRYERMSRPSFPFGDGKAAPRIAAIVEEFVIART